MTTKHLITGLTVAGFLAAAPLAFAQTTGTTGTTGSNTTYTSTGSTGTNTNSMTGASSTGSTGTTGTTPGVPNTGAGGDAAQNILLLSVSAIVALGGVAYLSLKGRTA